MASVMPNVKQKVDFSSLDIDWTRIAEPQPDGYDVEKINVVRKILFEKVNLPKVKTMELFKGNVALYTGHNYYENRPGTTCISANLKEYETHIKEVERLIYAHLPTYALSIEKLIDVYYPTLIVANDKILDFKKLFFVGCVCGDLGTAWDDTVVMMSSVGHPLGGADGLIHETWHHRLNCLGIDLTKHSHNLISNPVEELYDSPVRKDIKRPMSAVVQGEYSYIGVTEFYNKILQNINDLKCYGYVNVSSEGLSNSLKDFVNRIKEGIVTIEKNLVPVKGVGEDFFSGYVSYCKRVILETEETLRGIENQ